MAKPRPLSSHAMSNEFRAGIMVEATGCPTRPRKPRRKRS